MSILEIYLWPMLIVAGISLVVLGFSLAFLHSDLRNGDRPRAVRSDKKAVRYSSGTIAAAAVWPLALPIAIGIGLVKASALIKISFQED